MMINNHDEISEVFFQNNGETDLLTGSIAPNLFNQLVQRDINLSKRNNASLSLISLNLNLTKILNEFKEPNLKVTLENQLITIYFELKKFFRNSDCICRISQLGFWILVTGLDEDSSEKILNRLANTLPNFINISISHRGQGQELIDWYSEVDLIHFKSIN